MRRLRNNKSGNALMIVALAMPALIGGTGFAVDTAQWYLWKRELQFSVDQAAIAGAWARGSSSSSTQATYAARARQEYAANLSVTSDYATSANDIGIVLDDYGTGTDNSVTVTASASKLLPFSGFITGNAATVTVSAQAVVELGQSYEVCMFAVDPHADSAFKFGGSVDGDSSCGVGTLSDDENAAMKEAGNTDNNLGDLIAVGGIDSSFDNNGTLFPETSGLSDPYEGIETPDSSSSSAQTYSCPTPSPGGTTTTATVSTSSIVQYVYVQANNASQGENRAAAGTYTYSSSPYISPTAVSSTSTGTSNNVTVASGTADGSYTDSSITYTDMGQVMSSPKVRRIQKTFVRTTYTNVVETVTPANDGVARPAPGIYSTINIACQTEFSAGIYFITSSIDFGQNLTVTGTGGVLFVLTGSGDTIHINSNSQVSLSGITAATLISDYGYSADAAAELNGMLIFDKDGDEDFIVNGNANINLSGIIYTPGRDIKLNGNGENGGGCLMIASRTLTFLGNFSLDNFCIPTDVDAIRIGGYGTRVRLVS